MPNAIMSLKSKFPKTPPAGVCAGSLVVVIVDPCPNPCPNPLIFYLPFCLEMRLDVVRRGPLTFPPKYSLFYPIHSISLASLLSNQTRYPTFRALTLIPLLFCIGFLVCPILFGLVFSNALPFGAVARQYNPPLAQKLSFRTNLTFGGIWGRPKG